MLQLVYYLIECLEFFSRVRPRLMELILADPNAQPIESLTLRRVTSIPFSIWCFVVNNQSFIVKVNLLIPRHVTARRGSKSVRPHWLSSRRCRCDSNRIFCCRLLRLVHSRMPTHVHAKSDRYRCEYEHESTLHVVHRPFSSACAEDGLVSGDPIWTIAASRSTRYLRASVLSGAEKQWSN